MIDASNIATALGVATPASTTLKYKQWTLWISDAQRAIERHREQHQLPEPNFQDRDYVVREAVVAQVRRPDDATRVNISVDDGTTTREYQSSTGRVTIRDEWLELLWPNQLSDVQAYSVRPSFVPDNGLYR